MSCQISFGTFNLILEMLELHGIEADCKHFSVKNFSAVTIGCDYVNVSMSMRYLVSNTDLGFYLFY